MDPYGNAGQRLTSGLIRDLADEQRKRNKSQSGLRQRVHARLASTHVVWSMAAALLPQLLE